MYGYLEELEACHTLVWSPTACQSTKMPRLLCDFPYLCIHSKSHPQSLIQEIKNSQEIYLSFTQPIASRVYSDFKFEVSHAYLSLFAYEVDACFSSFSSLLPYLMSTVALVPEAKLLESSSMAALRHLQTSVLATKWKVTSLSSRPPLTEALTIQAMVTRTRYFDLKGVASYNTVSARILLTSLR